MAVSVGVGPVAVAVGVTVTLSVGVVVTVEVLQSGRALKVPTGDLSDSERVAQEVPIHFQVASVGQTVSSFEIRTIPSPVLPPPPGVPIVPLNFHRFCVRSYQI